MYLLFSTLSRFVVAFLLKSKHLLIWVWNRPWQRQREEIEIFVEMRLCQKTQVVAAWKNGYLTWFFASGHIALYFYYFSKKKNMMCAYVCTQLFSCVHLFVTPWTVAWQAPLSMEVTRQDYWSELPCPPPRDHPDPGIKPVSPALTGMFFTICITWEAHKAQTGVKERESRGGQR